jgi:antitoxin component of RelBE/YafQ-DinJ toxin-antitoxin module
MRSVQFTKTVAFRVSADTEKELAAVAERLGLSLGELARKLVLEGVGRAAEMPAMRRHVSNPQELRAILGELGRQGSLLNQIARVLNFSGPTKEALDALARIQGEYADAVSVLRRVLGVPRPR